MTEENEIVGFLQSLLQLFGVFRFVFLMIEQDAHVLQQVVQCTLIPATREVTFLF